MGPIVEQRVELFWVQAIGVPSCGVPPPHPLLVVPTGIMEVERHGAALPLWFVLGRRIGAVATGETELNDAILGRVGLRLVLKSDDLGAHDEVSSQLVLLKLDVPTRDVLSLA